MILHFFLIILKAILIFFNILTFFSASVIKFKGHSACYYNSYELKFYVITILSLTCSIMWFHVIYLISAGAMDSSSPPAVISSSGQQDLRLQTGWMNTLSNTSTYSKRSVGESCFLHSFLIG